MSRPAGLRAAAVALGRDTGAMIFIAARFRVLAEHADAWPDITRSFTEATRAEPGNLWFEWSRNTQLEGTEWSELGELAVDR